MLKEVQTNFLILRTATEMQNDLGMTSQIVYFRFISLFGNNFTKICYKFDENTSFQEKRSKTLYEQPFQLFGPFCSCCYGNNIKI